VVAEFVRIDTVRRMNPESSYEDTLRLNQSDAEIRRVVANYRTRMLSPVQWASCEARVRELVLQSEPANTEDARTMLAALCRFLTDSCVFDTVDVDALLTEAAVSSWAAARSRCGSAGAVSVAVGRLKRMLRVRAGMPSRDPRPAAPRRSMDPLSTIERCELEQVLIAESPAVVAAYVAVAGCGLKVSKAVGRVEVDNDRAWFVTETDRRLVLSPFVSLARGLADVGVVRADWGGLQGVAARVGVPLPAKRARATFEVLALAEPVPMVELVRSAGLSLCRIDAAWGHRGATPDNSDATRALRGVPSAGL
jgi:hypothetical protein